MSLYCHQNGDCGLTCIYCAWEDDQEAAERALLRALLDEAAEADEP